MPFLCLMPVHVSAWPLVRVLNGLQHLSHDKYHGGQGKVRGKTDCFFFTRLEFSKMRIKTQGTVNLILLSCSKYGKLGNKMEQKKNLKRAFIWYLGLIVDVLRGVTLNYQFVSKTGF